MKPMDDARAGLLSQLIEEDRGFDTLRAVERDAYEQGRAEGRREALLEAAKVCEGLTRLFIGRDDALGAQFACVEAIRKLIEAEKGGGGSQESGKDVPSVAPSGSNIHGGKNG